MTITTTTTARDLAIDLICVTLQDGGLTFSTELGTYVKPDKGYAVSGGFPGLILPIDGDDDVQVEAIAKWIEDLPKVEYIGTWVDNGNIYIDTTDIVTNRAFAVALGKHRREIAIWDFAANDEIRL